MSEDEENMPDELDEGNTAEPTKHIPTSPHAPKPPEPAAVRNIRKAGFIINLFMSNFLANVLAISLLILLPTMKSDLSLGYIGISWLILFALLATEVGHYLATYLVEKLSIYHLILITNISQIFSCLILAFAGGFFGLLLGTILVCVARSLLNKTDRILVPYSSKLLANYGMVSSLLLCSLGIAYLIDYQIPWQKIFFLFMPVSLILVILNNPYLKKHSAKMDLPELTKDWLKEFLSISHTWGYMALHICLQVLSFVFLMWVTFFLQDHLGKSSLDVGIVISLWFAGFIISRLIYDGIKILAPYIPERWKDVIPQSLLNYTEDRQNLLLVGLAVFCISLFISILMASKLPYILMLGGIFSGYLFPLLHDFLEERFEEAFHPARRLIYVVGAGCTALLHLALGIVVATAGLKVMIYCIPIIALATLVVGFLFTMNKPLYSGS